MFLLICCYYKIVSYFIKCVIEALRMVLWPLMLNSSGNRLSCMYSCLKHRCSLGLRSSRKESDRILPACFTFSRGQGCRVSDKVLHPPLNFPATKEKKKPRESGRGKPGAKSWKESKSQYPINVGSTMLLDNRVLLKDTASFSRDASGSLTQSWTPSRQTNQQIWNMFDIRDSWSGCLQQKSCYSHWERAEREAPSHGCCTLCCTSTSLSAGIPLMFFISLFVSFCTEVTFHRPSVYKISCLKSPLWICFYKSRYLISLDESSSVL